jgi:hypothetical protein
MPPETPKISQVTEKDLEFARQWSANPEIISKLAHATSYFEKLSILKNRSSEPGQGLASFTEQRPKMLKFRGNLVRVLDLAQSSASNRFKRSTLKRFGSQHATYSFPGRVDTEAISNRKKGFKTDPEDIQISDSLELLLSDYPHFFFRGNLEYSPTSEFDDLIGGADVIVVSRKNPKPLDPKDNIPDFAFSYDVTRAIHQENLDRKFLNIIEEKLRNIIYIDSNSFGKFSAINVPHFILPISKYKLEPMAKAYYEQDYETLSNLATSYRKELHFFIYEQIVVFINIALVQLFDSVSIFNTYKNPSSKNRIENLKNTINIYLEFLNKFIEPEERVKSSLYITDKSIDRSLNSLARAILGSLTRPNQSSKVAVSLPERLEEIRITLGLEGYPRISQYLEKILSMQK